MNEDLEISKEVEDKLRAGCVWRVWCGRNSTKEEIEKYADKYSISYETAMKWRDYWFRLFKK